MNDFYEIFSYFTTFLYLVAEIILLIASLMLLAKRRNAVTIFMVIASLASVFLFIGTTVFYKVIEHFGGNFEYGIVISILGGLASIAFGIALLLFVMNYVKKPARE